MSAVDVIFFACFILLLGSVAGLSLGRLIWRLLIPAPDPRKKRTPDDGSRADESMRPWHFSE